MNKPTAKAIERHIRKQFKKGCDVEQRVLSSLDHAAYIEYEKHIYQDSLNLLGGI